MLENENNVKQTTELLTENNASSQEIENKVNEAEIRDFPAICVT
ncbi:hypothetical protein [Spiroplasma endosymbiont of Aleiodes alternator]